MLHRDVTVHIHAPAEGTITFYTVALDENHWSPFVTTDDRRGFYGRYFPDRLRAAGMGSGIGGLDEYLQGVQRSVDMLNALSEVIL